MAVERGLTELEYPDTVAGRRRHLEWVEGCVDWNNAGVAGDELPDGLSLQATFQRGWYFGSEAFREKLLKALGREERGLVDRRRSGYTGAQTRDHGEAEAERVVSLAQEEIEVPREENRRTVNLNVETIRLTPFPGRAKRSEAPSPIPSTAPPLLSRIGP